MNLNESLLTPLLMCCPLYSLLLEFNFKSQVPRRAHDYVLSLNL